MTCHVIAYCNDFLTNLDIIIANHYKFEKKKICNV